MRHLLPLLFVLLFVPACDSGGSNEGPSSVAGRWEGEATVQGTTYTITFNLQQPSATSVTGVGTIATSQNSHSLNVRNGFLNSTSLFISLELFYETMRPALMSGTVSDDFTRIDATWNGPLLGVKEITLTRP